ncbi:F-box protein SKP2A-like [Contarinia nasturtii]|uniref:F-box protein SKP2A-like n=1 Tax=Contarinia nasturtii TaxID=265458 RepID=UPI0012D3BBD2|nr:F-box protein SKP2A-like [Contarinia nasturtii]
MMPKTPFDFGYKIAIKSNECKLLMRKHSLPTLYRLCIRVIARNVEQSNQDNWDLSQLPSTIKIDLLQLNMKLSIGFSNENIFIQLLTPNVTQLVFRSSIVTDSMLDCIGERCKYLQELRIFDSKDNGKQLEMSTDGLNKCIKRLKCVKALQIAGSDKVTDKTVEMISQSCRNLESLWLNDCKNVTDDSSDYFKSMQLNDLNLANTGVTDKWLSELANSTLMESLRDICLKNCKLSQDGLRNLNWNRLENVNIIGVSIRDLSFIPTTASYKTLNWSV